MPMLERNNKKTHLPSPTFFGECNVIPFDPCKEFSFLLSSPEEPTIDFLNFVKNSLRDPR